jgi:hypothetical protein
MTFSFDPALADDVSLLRFELGDDHSEGHYLEDETIQALISANAATAKVQCIRYIIRQLSQPDFKLDWLQVSMKEARLAYQEMLDSEEASTGTGRAARARSTISLPRRVDNYQTDNDYTELSELPDA